MSQGSAQPALALGRPQGHESFAGLPAGPSLSLQQPMIVQLQAGQPYYSNVVATPAAFGVMLQTGQPPTATLFVGIGETVDEIKRRVIRELERRLEKLEPKLSRISDEEIVRLIRGGQGGEGLSGCIWEGEFAVDESFDANAIVELARRGT